jgi:hypothetical protein
VQNIHVDLTQPVTRQISKNPFIQKALETYNKIGNNTINKIINLESMEGINISHKFNLANYNNDTITIIANLNPIDRIIFLNEANKYKITNLYQIPIARDELSLDSHNPICKTYDKLNEKIRNTIEINRNKHFDNECETSIRIRNTKIPIDINIFRNPLEIKSSEIRKAVTNELINMVNNDNENPFKTYRNIRHPRERQTQFLLLHNKFYNNVRLAKFKIIDSDKCETCGQVEDNEHIFINCKRAKSVWKCVNQTINQEIPLETITNGSQDSWLNNIISLAKHKLAVNRKDSVNIKLLETQIKNRCSDIRFITKNRENDKNFFDSLKICIKQTQSTS